MAPANAAVETYLANHAATASRGQRCLNVFGHVCGFVERRIAFDDLVVLVDQKLGEVPFDGLAAQQAGNLLARA